MVGGCSWVYFSRSPIKLEYESKLMSLFVLHFMNHIIIWIPLSLVFNNCIIIILQLDEIYNRSIFHALLGVIIYVQLFADKFLDVFNKIRIFSTMNFMETNKRPFNLFEKIVKWVLLISVNSYWRGFFFFFFCLHDWIPLLYNFLQKDLVFWEFWLRLSRN